MVVRAVNQRKTDSAVSKSKKVKKTNKNDLQNTTQKATEYLSQMTNECSLCGNHNLELIASFMTYMSFCT